MRPDLDAVDKMFEAALRLQDGIKIVVDALADMRKLSSIITDSEPQSFLSVPEGDERRAPIVVDSPSPDVAPTVAKLPTRTASGARMGLGYWLKKMRMARNITQTEIGKTLNIDAAAIENDCAGITPEALRKIEALFGETAPRPGEEPEPPPWPEGYEKSQKGMVLGTGDWIREQRTAMKLSRREVAAWLGRMPQTITAIEEGRQGIYLEHLTILEEKFGVELPPRSKVIQMKHYPPAQL